MNAKTVSYICIQEGDVIKNRGIEYTIKKGDIFKCTFSGRLFDQDGSDCSRYTLFFKNGASINIDWYYFERHFEELEQHRERIIENILK